MSHKHFLIKVAKQLIGTVRYPTELDKEDTENLDEALAHNTQRLYFLVANELVYFVQNATFKHELEDQKKLKIDVPNAISIFTMHFSDRTTRACAKTSPEKASLFRQPVITPSRLRISPRKLTFSVLTS